MATILVFHDEVAFKFSSFLSSPDISWTNIENFSTAIFTTTTTRKFFTNALMDELSLVEFFHTNFPAADLDTGNFSKN